MSHRFGFGLVLLLAVGCTKSPAEEAAQHAVKVTDYFKKQGGVLITESHVLTAGALVESVDQVYVVDGAKKKAESKVVKRAKDLGIALLYVKNKKEHGAVFGEAAALVEGDVLTAQVYSKGKTPALITGTSQGWRYSEGLAYLQTDMPFVADDLGAGVFGPDGKLVGLLAFSQGEGLHYILPIEYTCNGDRALTANPETRRAVGLHEDSDEFAAIRAEALKHPEALAQALTFKNIFSDHTFSRTALVGSLTMLDKREAPAYSSAITYKVEAVDSERNRRVLAEGTLPTSDVRWFTSAEVTAGVAKGLATSYGQEYVAEHLTPHAYGELRFRVPFGGFCSEVTGEEVHALTLTLADGRKSGEMAYSDMVNICAADEDGEGSALEEEWGMSATVAAPVEAASVGKAKKKNRKKKKKKKKKGKKRRR